MNDTPRFQSLWDRTRHTLEELKRLLDSQHIPWLLIVLPSEVQIDDRLEAVSAEFLRVSPDNFNFDKPQEILAAWAEFEFRCAARFNSCISGKHIDPPSVLEQ